MAALAFVALALSSRSAAQDAVLSARGLPPAVVDLMYSEQRLLSRAVDTRRIVSPEINRQDPRYSPEAAAPFAVKTYWVDAAHMHWFQAEQIPPAMRDLFVRERDGRTQVRLVVHPESESFYAGVVRDAERAEDWNASATSSSRTLLVWRDGHEARPMFVKVSLDREIGGVVRTVPAGEVARSIGTTNVLAREPEMPTELQTMPEVFSLIPRGMARGGMIVREIPESILTGQSRYVPLFSLYASPPDGGPPMLARMIRAARMSPTRYVRERIIRPFARLWTKLAVEHGIMSEPHAQNVLIEVGRDGQPTGHFLIRDFGGFNVDLAVRQRLGLPQSTLPIVTSVAQDYHQAESDRCLASLDRYFVSGFLHNLDVAFPAWRRAGFLPSTREASVTRAPFGDVLAQEVAAVLEGGPLRYAMQIAPALRASRESLIGRRTTEGATRGRAVRPPQRAATSRTARGGRNLRSTRAVRDAAPSTHAARLPSVRSAASRTTGRSR